jgi:hypothetical protein
MICLVFFLGALMLSRGSASGENPAFSPLPPEAKEALHHALTRLSGEYAVTTYYATVVEKRGRIEPYRSLLELEKMRCERLLKLCKKYQVSLPHNPYLRKISVPQGRREVALYGLEFAQRNIRLYDHLLPDIQEYPDIRTTFRRFQRETREVHLPRLRAAAEEKTNLSRRL